VEVLTRIAYPEIHNVSRDGCSILIFHCIMNGARGVRELRFYFHRPSHLQLLEAALQTFELVPLRFLTTLNQHREAALHLRIQHARERQSIPLPEGITNHRTINWNSDERLSRVLFPCYNEQVVWLSESSEEMVSWLNDAIAQAHYVYRGNNGVRIHRSPIEAAIESFLYGWGSWLRDD